MRTTRLQWHHTLPAFAVAVACLLGLLVWAQWQSKDFRLAQEARVQQALTASRMRLETTLASTFAVTASVEALLRFQPNLDGDQLRTLMDGPAGEGSALRVLTLAPNDVVRWVYPYGAREGQLGLDYRDKTELHTQVQWARQLRVPLFFAPVTLSTGRLGILQRRPVFLPKHQQSTGGSDYWGVVTAGADLATVAASAGLDKGELDLLVANRLADGRSGEVIWGSAMLLGDVLVRDELHLLGSHWVLQARPRGGWVAWAWWRHPTLWLGLAGTGVLFGLALALGRRRAQLETHGLELQAEVQRREASQALAEAATARFEGLVASASDWLWETDAEHGLHFPSQQDQETADLHGTLTGKPRWERTDLLPGADWDNHRSTLRRREPFRNFEYGYAVAGGLCRFVSISGTPCFDVQGHFTGYRGTGRDITKVREAQTALAETNQRLAQTRDELQAVMDSALVVAIVVVDLGGTVRLFSRGAEHVLGCSAADVVGTSAVRFHWLEEVTAAAAALAAQLGRPVSRHEVFERQAAGLDGGHTRQWTYVRRDTGEHRLVSHTFTQLRNKDGLHSGYVAIAQDMTEIARTQRELHQANARMQAVLDASVEVGILLGDAEGRALLVNRGAELLSGYSADQIVGRMPAFLHEPDELRARMAELTVELGRPVKPVELFLHQAAQPPGLRSRMWTYVRPDGTRVPASLTVSEVRDAQGNLMGFLGVARDMTEQLAAQRALERLNDNLSQRVEARTRELALAQAELMRSERLASLGGMVAGVAHELNTPIGIGLTAASTLEDRCTALQAAIAEGSLRRSTLDEFVRDAQSVAELVLRSLGQAADLVTHFKQLSADQTSEQRRTFSVAQVVNDVMVLLRPQLKAIGMTVKVDVPPDLEMDSYPGALGRLLSNLLLNAKLHAFDPPGAVAAPTVTIQAAAAETDHLLLTVSDNGCGMRPEVRRRAFDPFYSTKLGQGGTGLGLSIVHNAATTVLGGSVRLTSQLGVGTQFSLKLPRNAPLLSEPGNLTGFAGLG